MKNKVGGFLKLCEVFTLPDLVSAKNRNIQSSIYAIFFKGGDFVFQDLTKDVAFEIILNGIEKEKIDKMFEFFRVLIDISPSYYDSLKETLNTFQRIAEHKPEIKEQVENIIEYAESKPEKEINLFESAVSPTPVDLFQSKKKQIDNSIYKSWDSFKQYKKTMIDLTKENFYSPFRTNLEKLKQNQLDPRDLFLYQNVFIPFTTNTDNYKVFKDCNFFLSFEIRPPPNWKKKITMPDWKRTEQLGNRSLLILSTSDSLLTIDAVCRSCAAARSTDPDLSRTSISFLNKQIVPVVLIDGKIDENKKYFMFEPTSCWPAVQPILQRLLKMDEIHFPQKLLDKIVKLDFSDNKMPENNQIQTDILMRDRPEQSRQSNYLKMASETWEFDRYSPIQMSNLLRVDHEQYRALRYALTHNLTLVNGAPGTGKTHFAREYLRIMMNLRYPKPIAVVTYTNHALDSILEGVLDFLEPESLIRWGGPMRSTNEQLKRRMWMNRYLSKEIRDTRNVIVTMKQNLKNMYNIRQMAAQSIELIKKDPTNIVTYFNIMIILNKFFDASKKMASRYPNGLTPDEEKEYNKYLNNRDDRIKHVYLPSENDAIKCWLLGEQYYQNRNKDYRETLNYNKSIVMGEGYHNPFEGLNGKSDANKNDNNNDDDDYYYDDEEEDESKSANKNETTTEFHPSPDDFATNAPPPPPPPQEQQQEQEEQEEQENNNDDNNNVDDEEDEEEIDDRIYNDEDVNEMTRVSFEDTEIGNNLPEKYVSDFLVSKFDDLFAVKNPGNKSTPGELMIAYLKAISSPLTRMIEQLEKDLQKEEIKFNDDETNSAGGYLRKMKLIGMTSTVASVRKEALEVAGCEILIVEEAGELTESMLTCILPHTLKRLILIGDYQQLRPKVEHEMVGYPCNYDISLFEKLVVNARKKNAKCLFTLSVQRRMHPQISKLIRDVFYSEGKEKITDAESTHELGIPFGIPHRVRFYMHSFEEDKKLATRSHVNKEEAKFAASLVPFFICRGYKPEDITIISLYKGQMFQIQREIENLYNECKKSDSMKLYDPFGSIRSPHQIKVVVLDNFQGEENKVIIVSLTRSDKPGFVKNRNRALVTLSRAREMLVVLGHERAFGKDCKNNEQWKEISQKAEKLSPFSMSKPKQLGIAVNKCFIHDPNSTNVPSFLQKSSDVLRFRFSFCKEKCNHKLPCGHFCKLNCHCHSYPPGPEEHDDYYCPFRCERLCPNGHQCHGVCGRCTHTGRCENCMVKIHHVFPCKHESDVECYLVTSGKAKCRAECGKVIDRCGHVCRLKCGHQGDHDCKVEIEKECENCHRKYKYKCGDENPRCERQCNFILPCGHTCSNRCYVCIRNHAHNTECQLKCSFVFPCGHECPHKCCDKFPAHQHFYCKEGVNLNHNFVGNHNKNNIFTTECSMPLSCSLPCQHSCSVCQKRCTKKCSEKCIERCNCRCGRRCNMCGKRCRALEGEKCAIFCQHCLNVEEPPEKDGLVYLFHDNHFLLLDEAKRRVQQQYEAIFNGAGDLPVPVTRLKCPCDDCRNNEPCILGSWLFDKYNKDIENMLKNIRQISDKYIEKNRNDLNVKNYDKIHWYVCEDCKHLFFVKFEDKDNIIVKCPECGAQKGQMFE